MVGPNNKAEEPDAEHGIDYTQSAKGGHFTGMMGDNMGDGTKAGEDEDIDFRMAEESEEMLIKNGVPPAPGVKEGGVEVPVGQ